PASTLAGESGVSAPVSGLRAYCETVVVNLLAAYALRPSGLTTIRATPLPAPTLPGESADNNPEPSAASALGAPPRDATTKARRSTRDVRPCRGQRRREGSMNLRSRSENSCMSGEFRARTRLRPIALARLQ